MCQMYHKWFNQSGKAMLGLFLILLSCNLSYAQPGASKAKEAATAAKSGDCASAIKKYAEAIQIEPTNYKYYYKKAQCEIKERDLVSAKVSLENSVRVNKNFSGGYVTLAKIYTKEGDFNKAVDNYNKGFEVEGDQSKKSPSN